MAEDINGVRKALRGTLLADLPITPVMGDCLLISGVDPAAVLPAWRAARAVMPVTGRRPVFLDRDSPDLDDYVLPGDDEDEDDGLEPDLGEEPGRDRLTLLDQAAPIIDPWAVKTQPWWNDPVDDLSFHVPALVGADLLSEVRQQVTEPVIRTVNRFVYDRIRNDPHLLAQVPQANPLTGAENWFEPDRVELLLPPTTEPHLLAAWVTFYGTLGEDAVLASALRHWHEAWQAELVASWDTMLQFTTGRRPETGDDAFELAFQIALLASHLEMELWEIAIAVTRGDEWFLHNRP